MAAVDFKVLLLSAVGEPYWADVFHGSSIGDLTRGAFLAKGI